MEAKLTVFLNMNLIHQLKKNKKKTIVMKFKLDQKENNKKKLKNQKKLRKVLQNQLKYKFYLNLLFVINLIYKMQKAISNKIQLGDTLNPLDDYAGIPSINDEGTLENLIGKVDKVRGFLKTGKADGDLSRYFPNILPITRQSQVAGELPRKAYASVTYSDKKQLEFILDLTASTYSNYSTMEICLPLKFTKKSNKAQKMDAQMMTVNNFFGHWFTDIDIRRYPDDMRVLPTNNSIDIYQYSNAQKKTKQRRR